MQSTVMRQTGGRVRQVGLLPSTSARLRGTLGPGFSAACCSFTGSSWSIPISSASATRRLHELELSTRAAPGLRPERRWAHLHCHLFPAGRRCAKWRSRRCLENSDEGKKKRSRTHLRHVTCRTIEVCGIRDSRGIRGGARNQENAAEGWKRHLGQGRASWSVGQME